MTEKAIEFLSEKHQRIAGLIMHSLKLNHGSQEAKIKSGEILQHIRLRGYKIGDSELRQIIGHIRRNDICGPGFILADNGGYWYSESLDEMADVYKTEFSRALNVMLNFKPLRRRIKHLINQKDAML